MERAVVGHHPRFENDSTKPSGLCGVKVEAEETTAPDFQIVQQVANATE